MRLLARPIAGVDDELRVTIQDTAFWDPKAPVQVEAKTGGHWSVDAACLE